MDRYLVPPLVVLTDRLTKRDTAQAVGIVRVSLFECGTDGIFDTLRDIKVRFTHLQVDDVNALRLKLPCSLEDIHHQERLDLLRP